MGTEIIITLVVAVLLALSAVMLFGKNRRSSNDITTCKREENDDLRKVSYKTIVPLKIQACERLILYIERIQFPILVKRVFMPAMSRNDFQFSLLQNVQDEFEHNLAQRLYVTENTWKLIELAKEEVMQNINAVFNDNPDADVAMIAQKLASFENPMANKAVINIKYEFDAL